MYHCCVFLQFFNGRQAIRWEGRYQRLWVAKFITKIRAILVDWQTPHLDGDVGIYWTIVKRKEG